MKYKKINEVHLDCTWTCLIFKFYLLDSWIMFKLRKLLIFNVIEWWMIVLQSKMFNYNMVDVSVLPGYWHARRSTPKSVNTSLLNQEAVSYRSCAVHRSPKSLLILLSKHLKPSSNNLKPKISHEYSNS